MRFPKPLVILGFILIAAALGAGVYDMYRNKGKAVPVSGPDMNVLAKKSTDRIFAKLFMPFAGNENIPKDFLEGFKKQHEDKGIIKIADLAKRLSKNTEASAEDSLKLEDELYKEWADKLHSKMVLAQIITEEELKAILGTSDKE